MKALSQVKRANDAAQVAHFRARFERARRTNPNGFTLDSLGNHYDATRGGFAVGVSSYDSTDDLIRNNARVLACGVLSSLHFGYWRDASGRDYIDTSEVYASRTEALHAAKQRGELAIYDFARGVAIDTKTGVDIIETPAQVAPLPPFASGSPFAYFPILGARVAPAQVAQVAPHVPTLRHAVWCERSPFAPGISIGARCPNCYERHA